MRSPLEKKEIELRIFQNVFGEGRIKNIKHENYFLSNNLCDVIKNQGISRAKLREYIVKYDLQLEHWCKEDCYVFNTVK